MPEWKPLLEGEQGENARRMLEAMAEKVARQVSGQEEINLMTGMSGQLLFLSHCLPRGFDLERSCEDLLDRIAADKTIKGSFMNGLAGIGFVLKMVNEKHGIFDEEIIHQFYEYVRIFAKENIYSGEFDFMRGYLGECYFLLEEENSQANFDLFGMAVHTLRKLAIPQSQGVGWISATELRLIFPESDFSVKKKDCNLGMSHGSPGIILVLVKLAARYPGLELSSLISGALSCMQREGSEENRLANGYYYSIYAGESGKQYKGQLSWCYSDLSICLMYFKLWEISGEQDLWERANKIALSCADKRLEHMPGMNSGLCHGAAGIGHMFNKVYQRTGNTIYKDAARYWYSILFAEFVADRDEGDLIRFSDFNRKAGKREVVENNGFLQGLSGVGLSVLSALSEEEPVWDKVLLL
jgi:lantibiotic biosynthesis protein